MPESVLTRPEVSQRATIPILSADQLTSAAARALEEARQRLMAIEAKPLESVTAAGVLDALEDMGVSLPPERRRRFKEISERLTELAQEFARNIRENTTTLRFTPEECEGLPAAYLERVRRDAEGNIVVGFDYPDYLPFMMNVVNAGARKRYYLAHTNRATAPHTPIPTHLPAPPPPPPTPPPP